MTYHMLVYLTKTNTTQEEHCGEVGQIKKIDIILVMKKSLREIKKRVSQSNLALTH